MSKKPVAELGAPYVIIDEDGETDFTSNPEQSIKKLKAELDESDIDDGFRVGVYKLVKLYRYTQPVMSGTLMEVK